MIMRKTVLMPIAAIFALLVGSACKRDPMKATEGETIQDAYNVNYTMEFDAAHSVEDRKLLIDAKVDEIHKKLPPDFTPFELVDFQGSDSSTVVINKSIYNLNLYLSGENASETLHVDRYKCDSVKLPNGTYRVGVEIAPDMFMGGTVTLEGGRYVNKATIHVDYNFN